MNFSNILLIVYFFGEFVKMTVPALQLPGDSAEKKKQLAYVRKKISEQVFYRHHAEESARIKAYSRKTDFESYTENIFTTITEPDTEGRALKLWKKAKKALNDYNESKNLAVAINYFHL